MLVGVMLILAPAPAQQSPLRVLHVTPASAILPTEPVTVTFDRPVVGPLGHVVDVNRVASLQPQVPVRFEWRDPTTLRLVPVQPWKAGQVVTLVIDTTLVALDGSRLTSAARIPIRVKGPALRATLPRLAAGFEAPLPPDGRLRMLYSSEVDTVMLGQIVRYEFGRAAGCNGRIVPLRVAVHRPLATDDDYQFLYAAGMDSVVRGNARVVELVPASPVPDRCQGSVVVPSLDSLDGREIRYAVTSAPPFGISSLSCASPNDCAASGTITLHLTAPVPVAAARSGIRVDGAAPDFAGPPGPVVSWATLRVNPVARRVYRITLDSALTDVAGRPLTGPREIALEVGDRSPRVSHPAGFITLPRDDTPFIRVNHVNVDSAVLELWSLDLTDSTTLDAMRDARFPTRTGLSVTRRIALGGPRNEVQTTDVALPELTGSAAPRILSVRLRLERGAPG
jgi:hypothetical protein